MTASKSSGTNEAVVARSDPVNSDEYTRRRTPPDLYQTPSNTFFFDWFEAHYIPIPRPSPHGISSGKSRLKGN